LTLWQKRTLRKRSKSGGDSGTGVYRREEITSRVMAVDRPYGEFYDFYRVSSENFGYHRVFRNAPCKARPSSTFSTKNATCFGYGSKRSIIVCGR
jgi:hypothetical protein